jgi:hypothetical protein
MSFLKRFSTKQLTLAAAILVLIAGAILWASYGSNILAKMGQPPQATTEAKQQDSNIDPAAIDSVKKMSAYLRSLKVFQVQGAITHDDVLEDGLIIQSSSKVDMLAAKPNRLRAEVTSDDKHRLYLYDGKTFTAWGKLNNYYATVPAPPTIPELFKQVDEKFDIELPLIDLFKWGTNEDDINKIKTAIDAGPTNVEGVTCEQYVFHQEGVDWQVWIQLGDYPLPRRLVITTLTDEARPQHTMTLAWNLAPSFNDGAFVFDPPPDAKRILFEGQTADDTKKGK